MLFKWCNFLVPTLTARAADSSLPGQSLAAVFKARSIAIENLNPSLQLQALSKVRHHLIQKLLLKMERHCIYIFVAYTIRN